MLEDDDDDRKLFAEALKKTSAHIQFSSVSNGAEAIRFLQQHPEKPDIIFSDINMPLMNGFEFIRELKLVESCMDIPVVILSTLDVKFIRDSRDVEHIPFYRKPETFSGLCRIIEDVVEKFGTNEQ